jgi:hypothetical protein
MWSILLPEHAYRRCEDDIRHVKDAQHGVVLVSVEAKIFIHTISLRITEITLQIFSTCASDNPITNLVQSIEEVHDCEHRQHAQVKLQAQCLLVFKVWQMDGFSCARDGCGGIL